MAIKKSSVSGGGIPSGATGNRPIAPIIGDQFYNGTLGVLEIYTSSGWLPATGANDFNVAITGQTSTAVFNKEYFSGSYTIESSSGDTAYDIYLFASDGEPVGYSKTPAIHATQNFNKLVVIGGTTGDLLSFSYKTTFVSVESSDETKAGPVVISVSPSYMNSKNSSITISGKNFSNNISVIFTGTDGVDREAKSITYSSATQIIATRPDTFPEEYDPYTVRVENLGISDPTGTNAHILDDSVTAGTSPTWITETNLPIHSEAKPYSVTLVANDVELTNITYSLVSGMLPQWATINEETGEISGIPSGEIDGQPYSFVVRATDSGGNFTNKTFTMSSNTPPVWITTSGQIATGSSLQASGGTNGNELTFSVLSGTLHTGVFLSSTGIISGNTSEESIKTFTVRVTDQHGLYSDRQFSISTLPLYTFSSHTFTTAGASGQYGPTLAAIKSAYSSTTWADQYMSMDYSQGVQEWTVPKSGQYSFTVAGASGGGNQNQNGAYGALGTFTAALNKNEKIYLVVGQKGLPYSNTQPGAGGGGSFVAIKQSGMSDAILIAAIGGGAGRDGGPISGSGAETGQAGTSGGDSTVQGGDNGYGGNTVISSNQPGGGGAGWLSDGAGYAETPTGGGPPQGGRHRLNPIEPFAGGKPRSGYPSFGGFGGGGGSVGAAGGGGYSGGAGADYGVSAAGGGGSYIYASATSASITPGASSGNGYITITKV